MEGVHGSFSDLLENLTQEIQDLRERERKWMEERIAFLQRDRHWTEQWQERERFFGARELQWSEVMSENQRRFSEWKNGLDQELQEYKEREQILLKQLSIQTEKTVSKMDNSSQTSEEVVSKTNSSSQTSEEETLATSTNTPQHSDKGDRILTFGDIPKELQFWNDPSVAVVEMVPLSFPKTKAVKTTSKKQNRKMRKMSKEIQALHDRESSSEIQVSEENVIQNMQETDKARENCSSDQKKTTISEMEVEETKAQVVDIEKPSVQEEAMINEMQNPKKVSEKTRETISPEPREITAKHEVGVATDETVLHTLVERPLPEKETEVQPSKESSEEALTFSYLEFPTLTTNNTDLSSNKTSKAKKKKKKKGCHTKVSEKTTDKGSLKSRELMADVEVPSTVVPLNIIAESSLQEEETENGQAQSESSQESFTLTSLELEILTSVPYRKTNYDDLSSHTNSKAEKKREKKGCRKAQKEINVVHRPARIL